MRKLNLCLAALAVTTGVGTVNTAAATDTPLLPRATYPITAVDEGAKFEGIGVDKRRDRYYVSEVTGGEIHRGSTSAKSASPWLDGDGTDGRWTARGITTDARGNVYIAGGPNGIQHAGAPDLWVYSPRGELLAALRVPGSDTFLNDVVIGPDGAAYFTDTNEPRIIRVHADRGEWQAALFADGTGVVERAAGFNLGGLVVTQDRRALVVAQGNIGLLWRVDLATGAFTPVHGGTGLIDADGLVRTGDTLTVIRNFQRHVTRLRMSGDGRSVDLISDRPTDPERVLTTGKVLNGRFLVVDSRFEEPAPSGDGEVIVLPRR